MSVGRVLSCVIVLLITVLVSKGQATRSLSLQVEISTVMEESAANWNRGDLVAFAHLYKQSRDIVLVGPHNLIGFDSMLKFYESTYSSSAKRGVLTYSDLAVQPLDRRFTTATGHFHLERSPEGGGNQDGYFAVVFEKTKLGWKMVRDASFVTPPRSTTQAETL